MHEKLCQGITEYVSICQTDTQAGSDLEYLSFIFVSLIGNDILGRRKFVLYQTLVDMAGIDILVKHPQAVCSQ